MQIRKNMCLEWKGVNYFRAKLFYLVTFFYSYIYIYIYIYIYLYMYDMLSMSKMLKPLSFLKSPGNLAKFLFNYAEGPDVCGHCL